MKYKHLVGVIVRKILPKKLAKLIYRRLALKYILSLDCQIFKDKKTILMINHFYDQDIDALRRANTDYNIVVVQSAILFKGAKIFFDKSTQALESPYPKESDNNIIQYRNECAIIFKTLNTRFSIDLIVTPADNYYWIREFIMAAKEQKIKTVVYDKEGLISTHDFEAESSKIRRFAPLISDHIFVWSNRQQQYWEKAGVNHSNITVVGQARSDLFHLKAENAVDAYFSKPQKLVTFYTYDDRAYIPLNLLETENLTWQKMKSETQAIIAKFAIQFPHFNFVFKAHPQQSDLSELQLLYNSENLKVIGGAEISNELISRSELIIAFQTTAVLEAMFMNKRVIYTAWDPLIQRLKEQILPYDSAPGIIVADSAKMFTDVCLRFFANDYSNFHFTQEIEDKKHRMVSSYIFNPDGHVCKRFYREISRFMQ